MVAHEMDEKDGALRKRHTKGLCNSDEYSQPEEKPGELYEESYCSLCLKISGETVLGYILWSIFTSVPPTIWFYPLNELEISGYEVFSLLLLSPCLGIIPKFKAFLVTQYGIKLSRFLSVFGILSYQSPFMLMRLILNSVCSFFAMLWLLGLLLHPHKENREIMLTGFILGYILKLTVRIAGSTLNIIWASKTGNLAVCFLSLIVLYFLNYPEKPYNSNRMKKRTKNKEWILVGFGIGSWFFLVQFLFGEASVVLRWCGTGAQNTIFNPNPFSLFVLLSLSSGVLISTTSMITSKLWWLTACACSFIFYYGPHHIAFVASCIMALYTMSIFPALCNLIQFLDDPKSLVLALLVFIVEILASVWTVAYNFVPGGELTRESNHILLGITLLLIGVGSLCGKLAFSTCNGEEGKFEITSSPELQLTANKKLKVVTVMLLLAMFLTACVCMKSRHDNREAKRRQNCRETNVFTAAVWTVHFGFDNKGWQSFERAASFLNDTGADVIGILESDCARPYLGSTDFVQYMEESLGYYSDYGPATRDHTWGAGLLSRFPIVSSSHHLLPSPYGELSPAVSAVVNISGSYVTFVVVHMGNDRDDYDRQLQAEELAHIMDRSEYPVVFLGYVTSRPKGRDYTKLIEGGRMKDIDPDDSDRWCEYILYRDLIRLGYARISRGELSDTELQMARFKLALDPANYRDNKFSTDNQYDVDEAIRFPECFEPRRPFAYYGSLHKYHMGTPKYYI